MGLAARGARQLGEKAETIQDPAELAQVRRQAARVNLKSGLAALALTLVTLALPPWP